MANTKFELFEDKAGHFRWRLVSSNGNTVADSAEGYSSKSGAKDAVMKLKEWADTDVIEEIEN